MKHTISISDVEPDQIEYTVELLRMLKHKIISWYWIQGTLHVRCEKPRFKVKMKFRTVADYHQILKAIRRVRNPDEKTG